MQKDVPLRHKTQQLQQPIKLVKAAISHGLGMDQHRFSRNLERNVELQLTCKLQH